MNKHLVILCMVIGLSIVRGSTIYVPQNYTSIQEAIDTSDEFDTIFVAEGIYNENIVINKSLFLMSDPQSPAIITANVYVITIHYTSNVTISGFTIVATTYGGIFLCESYNNTIEFNSIESVYLGVLVEASSFNNFYKNTINGSSRGLYIYPYSNYNIFTENTIYSQKEAVQLKDTCKYNLFIKNTINSWGSGISLYWDSSNNIFFQNYIYVVDIGINLGKVSLSSEHTPTYTSSNLFIDNTIISTTKEGVYLNDQRYYYSYYFYYFSHTFIRNNITGLNNAIFIKNSNAVFRDCFINGNITQNKTTNVTVEQSVVRGTIILDSNSTLQLKDMSYNSFNEQLYVDHGITLQNDSTLIDLVRPTLSITSKIVCSDNLYFLTFDAKDIGLGIEKYDIYINEVYNTTVYEQNTTIELVPDTYNITVVAVDFFGNNAADYIIVYIIYPSLEVSQDTPGEDSGYNGNRILLIFGSIVALIICGRVMYSKRGEKNT